MCFSNKILQIFLTATFLNFCASFPQADTTETCQDNERLVPFSECDVDIDVNDEIVIGPRQGNILEDSTCCLEDKIIKGGAGGKLVKKPKTDCSDFEGYQCVIPVKCKDQILSERAGFDILSTKVDPSKSPCSNELEVCCKISSIEDQSGNPDTQEPTEKSVEVNKYVSRCGQHNIDGIETRSNTALESDTIFGEWPHACVIFKVIKPPGLTRTSNVFIGGGSLIAPGIILTAAHKVKGLRPSEINVRCGDWDLKARSEPIPHQNRGVGRVTVHPFYYNATTNNNFALLHVTEDFVLGQSVDTICLPKQPKAAAEKEYDSTACVAMGWGKNKHGPSGISQPTLKQVQLPIVDHMACQTKLRESANIPKNFKLDSSLLCAGGEENKDTCDGDGGGPLVCPAKPSVEVEKFIQVGIVAWGLECGNAGIPGVYASVAEGLCFIDWATKCVDGERFIDFYNIDGCSTWIDDEIARLQTLKAKYESRNLNTLTEGQKRVTLRDLAETNEYINNAEELKSSCSDPRTVEIN